jgi:hypothetical protein
MRAAIMQPTYLPWIGYFALMDEVDLFVLLDQVQFEKRSWQQRNRIKTPRGLEWLTVPATVRGRYTQSIRDVEINDAGFWGRHLRAIELNYARAGCVRDHFASLASALDLVDRTRLVDVNVALLEWVRDTLEITTPLLRASTLEVGGARSELLAAICERVGADEYVSARGSAQYLLDELDSFARRGVTVTFQTYEHPEYTQQFPPFIPFASAVDLVLNEGSRAVEIVRAGSRPRVSPAELARARNLEARDEAGTVS